MSKKEEKMHYNFKEEEKKIREEMEKAVEHFKNEIKKVKTGRASVGLLEDVKLEYYGSFVTIQQVASLRVQDPQTILIEPWDKGAIKNIEKAIVNLGLGFGVSSDGNYIRVHVPPLTEETKKEYVRHVHKLAEEAKIAIRNIRHEYHNKIRDFIKEGVISEDEGRRDQEELDKITHEFTKKIDELAKKKEAEIMEV